MTDRFAPPIELWDAKKCARVLNLRSVGAFKYQVQCGKLPAVWRYDGGKALWNADEIRKAARKEV